MDTGFAPPISVLMADPLAVAVTATAFEVLPETPVMVKLFAPTAAMVAAARLKSVLPVPVIVTTFPAARLVVTSVVYV